MKVAVLCPGPSLEKFRNFGFDLIIAVNRAANYCACDYVVALDAHTWPKLALSEGSKPKLVCKRQSWNEMNSLWPESRSMGWLELKNDWAPDEDLKWHTKGLTAALVLAWVKGADEVHCFGVDWKGEADYDGKTDVRNQRSAKRWTAEAILAGGVWQELLKHGVSVHGLPTLKGQ